MRYLPHFESDGVFGFLTPENRGIDPKFVAISSPDQEIEPFSKKHGGPGGHIGFNQQWQLMLRHPTNWVMFTMTIIIKN